MVSVQIVLAKSCHNRHDSARRLSSLTFTFTGKFFLLHPLTLPPRCTHSMIRNAATPLIAIKRCNKVTHALTQLSFRSIQYDHIQPPTRFIGKPKFKSKFKTQAPGGFSESPKYFLSPYELSQKIKGLCLEGRFDDAVFKLKNSPLDSQNVAVWNTMMVEAFKLNKYQVAYSLFIDVSSTI